MELYILDSLLRRVVLFEGYISLIWTERYNEEGEFEIVLADTREARNLFVYGAMLALKGSTAVMKVETSNASTDDDGKATYTIKGRSLEAILRARYSYDVLGSSNSIGVLTLTGTPTDIVKKLFDDSVRDGGVSVSDKIPFLQPGVYLPVGNIPAPEDIILVEIKAGPLYEPTVSISQEYHTGFRFVRRDMAHNAAQLYFETYMGNDRTTSQNVGVTSPGGIPKVVSFSTKMETLANVSELTSIAEYYNVAYVVAKNGSAIVYVDGADDSTAGFDRSVMWVDATDLEEPAGAALDALMLRRGQEALAAQRIVIAVDGEIPENSTYVYGVDYGLGDLVEISNGNGSTTNMRVTEHIYISDEEGNRSYPTLTLDQLITPGSWMAWNALQVWDNAVGEWGEV